MSAGRHFLIDASNLDVTHSLRHVLVYRGLLRFARTFNVASGLLFPFGRTGSRRDSKMERAFSAGETGNVPDQRLGRRGERVVGILRPQFLARRNGVKRLNRPGGRMMLTTLASLGAI